MRYVRYLLTNPEYLRLHLAPTGFFDDPEKSGARLQDTLLRE
jgi:hypothetical protein